MGYELDATDCSNIGGRLPATGTATRFYLKAPFASYRMDDSI